MVQVHWWYLGYLSGCRRRIKFLCGILHSFHDTIKFTVEYSKKSITFLDVTTYQEDNWIKSTLYVKPTDSHSYLDYYSCHPQTIKRSIPYSQFLRMRRNCTEWTMLTISALHRCNSITQCKALMPKEKENSNDDKSFLYHRIQSFEPTNLRMD